MANFLLLNPDFFLVASGPAQKAVLVPFLRGGIYDLFFSNFFLTSGGFQWGCFRSWKYQNLRAISKKTENWVPFGVKWATIGNYITRSKKSLTAVANESRKPQSVKALPNIFNLNLPLPPHLQYLIALCVGVALSTSFLPALIITLALTCNSLFTILVL